MFGKPDIDGIDFPHTDALVISVHIGAHWVNKILVDNGSSLNILFKSTFDKKKLSYEDLEPCIHPIYSFIGEGTNPLGVI